MKKLALTLAIILAFVLGFALNGVIQNCKTACERGGHASCCGKSGGQSCERHGDKDGDCCKKGAVGGEQSECCKKHAAGDKQECCTKHAAGDLQDCCSKSQAASPAAANEITVAGAEKACCKKGEHDKK
jgi:hypothetical protein